MEPLVADPKRRTLTEEIVKATRSVREKLKTLREGLSAGERVFERVHKPILEPLRSIADAKKKSPPLPPPEAAAVNSRKIRKQPSAVVKRSLSTTEEETEEEGTTTAALTEEEREIRSKLLEGPTGSEYLQQYHPRLRKYVQLFLLGGKTVDRSAFALKHDYITDSWRFGDSPVQLRDKDFIIKGKKYGGSDGLYQLMTLKKPSAYSPAEASAYVDIVMATNAHRIGFDPAERLRGHRGAKYTKIIKPFLTKRANLGAPSKSGRGVPTQKRFNDEPVEYVYWNDVSELVRRLRLLCASRAAGHSDHRNEIQSIIEELREEGVVE